MRIRLFVVIAFALSCGLVAAEPDKPKDDKRTLQGSWEVIEHQPRAIPDARYERLVFKGDKLIFHCRLNEQRDEAETEFKLDPKASPKAIDFTPLDGGNKGKTYLGIYELKEGKLKISYRGPGSTRPKGFDDKADGTAASTFIVLQRDPTK